MKLDKQDLIKTAQHRLIPLFLTAAACVATNYAVEKIESDPRPILDQIFLPQSPASPFARACLPNPLFGC